MMPGRVPRCFDCGIHAARGPNMDRLCKECEDKKRANEKVVVVNLPCDLVAVHTTMYQLLKNGVCTAARIRTLENANSFKFFVRLLRADFIKRAARKRVKGKVRQQWRLRLSVARKCAALVKEMEAS